MRQWLRVLTFLAIGLEDIRSAIEMVYQYIRLLVRGVCGGRSSGAYRIFISPVGYRVSLQMLYHYRLKPGAAPTPLSFPITPRVLLCNKTVGLPSKISLIYM